MLQIHGILTVLYTIFQMKTGWQRSALDKALHSRVSGSNTGNFFELTDIAFEYNLSLVNLRRPKKKHTTTFTLLTGEV